MSYSISDNRLVVDLPDCVLKAIDDGIIVADLFIAGGGQVDARFRYIANWCKSMSLTECVLAFQDNSGAVITKEAMDAYVRAGKRRSEKDYAVDADLVKRLEEMVTSADNELSVAMSYADARKRSDVKGLHQHRIQGVLNAYPVDSLCDNDFKRQDDLDFVARVVIVAHNITEDTASQKVKSLFHDKESTLREWWSKATLDEKVRMMTNSKRFKGNVSSERLGRLNDVAFPFN